MEKLEKIRELEKKTGYRFQKFDWLVLAMRHSSYTNEHHIERLQCNERLEFLGDAVLELVSSEFLYTNYPELAEGELTKLRASLVCEPTLAYDARALSLGDYLLLGKGEEATGGRQRDSIVSDAMEAVIGAIFMDGGFEAAKGFILRFVLDDVENKQLFHDSKTLLQEMVQKREQEEEVTYVILEASGPDHDKSFKAQVRIGDQPVGEGMGRTKKSAEQNAAYHALCRMKKR